MDSQGTVLQGCEQRHMLSLDRHAPHGPDGPQPPSVETHRSLILQHSTLKSAPSTSPVPSWGHGVGRKPVLDHFNVSMCGRWRKCRLIVQFFQYFDQTYFKNIGPEAYTVSRGKFTALLLRTKLPQAPASKGKTRKEMNSCLKTAHRILWVINVLAGTQSTRYWEILPPFQASTELQKMSSLHSSKQFRFPKMRRGTQSQKIKSRGAERPMMQAPSAHVSAVLH